MQSGKGLSRTQISKAFDSKLDWLLDPCLLLLVRHMCRHPVTNWAQRVCTLPRLLDDMAVRVGKAAEVDGKHTVATILGSNPTFTTNMVSSRTENHQKRHDAFLSLWVCCTFEKISDPSLVVTLHKSSPRLRRHVDAALEAKGSTMGTHCKSELMISLLAAKTFGVATSGRSHGSRSCAWQQFQVAPLSQVAWYLSSAARNPRSKRLFSASSWPTTASFGSTTWRLTAGRSSATAATKRRKTATNLRHITMLPRFAQAWP